MSASAKWAVAAVCLVPLFAGPNAAQPSTRMDSLPVYFEPNLGQFAPQVRFYARGAKYQAWITDRELVLGFTRRVPSRQRAGDHGKPDFDVAGRDIVRIQFGSQTPRTARGEEKLDSYSNYFLGKDVAKWRPNVPNYGRARLEDVYPGIDLVFYGKGNEIEYDFVVKPGADPGLISLRFEGPAAPALTARGDLSIALAAGTLFNRAPVTRQESRILASSAQWSRNRLGFQVGSYDKTQPLIIDPVLEYATYLGGTQREDVFFAGIAADAAGNAYVAGHTSSTDFPTTAGAYDTTLGSSQEDGFVTKLNSSGTGLVFSTYIGGTGYDRIRSVALDASGNIYVSGETGGSDYPTTSGAFDTTANGGTDVVVTKLAPAGNALLYSTYIGGGGFETNWALAVDSSGNAVVAVNVPSGVYPTTSGAFDVSANGVDDVAVTKLNASGTGLIYSTYLGGSGSEFAYGLAVDSAGSAYVTGSTGSTNFPTTSGSFATVKNGGYDAYVTVLNPSGTALIYSTFLGGSVDDYGYGVAVDSSGNAYLSGSTNSSNFPVTGSAFDTSYNGSTDTFIAKLNATGNTLVFATFLGGNGNEWGYDIAVDSSGSAIATGYTGGNFPNPAGAPLAVAGGFDAYIAKFTPGGGLAQSAVLGGSSQDYGSTVAVDAAGNAYIAGFTLSANLPTTPGAFDSTYGGNGTYDVFVAKYSFGVPDSTPPVITASLSVSPNANGWNNSPVTVSFSVTDADSPITSQTGCATVTISTETSASGTTLTCTATSGGGTSSKSVTVKIDMTAPGISGAPATPPNANGWHNANLNVNYTCTDSLSGPVNAVKSTFVSTEGAAQPISNSCEDRAGNTRALSVPISLDKTAPTITVARTPDYGPVWTNSDITVNFACADSLSGPASAGETFVVTTEGFNQSRTSTCYDRAGNASVPSTIYSLNIDKTPPVITASRAPAANANGWNNTDVTVSFSCTDSLSGAVAPNASYVKSAEGAGQSQSHACQDLAGNSSALNVMGINIDKTAPAVSSVTGLPNPVMVNAAFSLQASLSDGGPSGLALAEYRIDAAPYLTLAAVSGASANVTGSAGSFAAPTVANTCVRATDLAGNTSAEECALVAVYDPNGGFVTGGGTIQSSAGALTAQPGVSGRAQFAFVSKYLPGAQIPSGNTGFKFKAGNFEFDSTSYEWLVVAGARAQYKGAGVIKGVSGSFQFLLTAIDGDQPGGGGQDKFRLKVFAEGGGMIYDNNLNLPDSDDPSTVIESGSIQVHKN